MHTTSEFSPAAHWLWTTGEPSPRNFWLRIRRTFSCSSSIYKATLLITADSRYEVYINGTWLGHGPVRGFPWHYSYDAYDITSFLSSEQSNVLAANMVHWGDHTFQYIRGRAGFLCELVIEYSDGQVERIGSDEQWKVSPDQAFLRQVPRLTLQQAFEEHYDGRKSDEGWTTLAYNDEHWEAPVVLGPVGTAPWLTLSPRTIPFLSCDVVYPTRVLAAELAQLLPGYLWCFDMRHHYNATDVGLRGEAQEVRGRAFATEIIAPYACEIELRSFIMYDTPQYSCNGQLLLRRDKLSLQEGRNLFVINGTEWPSLLFATDIDLQFDASRIVPNAPQDCAWAFLGPYMDDEETQNRILSITAPGEFASFPIIPILASDTMEDVALRIMTQRFLLPEQGFCDVTIDSPQPRQRLHDSRGPLVEQVSNLLHQNADYTTLYPQSDGDIHLVIDFDRELIGYLAFDIDTSEGTIVDASMFEGIDNSGIFWTDMLRNSFRYTCREGLQSFRSHFRRGFRYLSLTIRGAQRPVRLYNVRCLFSTYPVEQRGRFTCSDALLTKIWEVATYTVQLCMEDTYTDCPAYEQTTWVGDARNSALVNAIAFGAYPLTDRTLRLTGQSLSHNLDAIKPPQWRQRPHLTTDHVVSGWFSQIPMWTFLWIWNIWEHYLYTGDQSFLADLYHDVQECIQRCLTFLTERDLLDIPHVWNLVDWAAMDLTWSGEATANNVLFVESLRRAAQMADTLAEQQDTATYRAQATEYRSLAERIRTAVNTYCWSEAYGAYIDTVRDEVSYQRYLDHAPERGEQPETLAQYLARTRFSEPTNTLVLQCGCATPDRGERILPLVEAAREGKFIGSNPNIAPQWPAEQAVPVGSPWFLFFTLETLIAQGKFDLAMTILREQWGRMLKQGATSFWETFPNLQAQHWSRSLCHGWSAAPAYFLSTYILGVQPAEPGFASILIEPRQWELQWADGYVPTPHGDVRVRWSRQEDALEIEIDLPPAIPGILLTGPSSQQPALLSGPQGELNQQNGRWQVHLAAGSRSKYRI